MKLVPAAHYTDAEENSFVFFQIGGEVFCYRAFSDGRLIRQRDWGRFPERTTSTLLNIVGWLKMDTEIPSYPDGNPNFRTTRLDSCNECGGMFA
jgi:hypothetical protein